MSSFYQSIISNPNLSTFIYPALFSLGMLITMSYLTTPLPTPPHSSPTSPSSPKLTSSQSPSSSRKKTLFITSHDRHTALTPTPDLHYDLRLVPNPPRELRVRHTGHSREIQDGLLREPRFCKMLEEAERDIRGAMMIRMVGDEDGRSSEERKGEGEVGEEEDIMLRVGCLCGSGHHRSVAFSEQLAMVEWPGDWRLELRHRDLTVDVKRRKALERRK